MTNRQWGEVFEISDELGGDCRSTIEELGRKGFEAMQKKLTRQFPSHSDKTQVEWVMGMWRYHQAMKGRQFTERELDKVARWAFYLLPMQVQVDGQYQALVLASGDISDNKNIAEIRKVIVGLENLSDEADKTRKQAKKFFDNVSGLGAEFGKTLLSFKGQVYSPIEGLSNAAGQLAIQTRKALKAIEELARLANVDTQQVKSKKDNMESLDKQIDSIETELNLRVKHGSGSREAFMTEVLAKGDRFVKDNPQLFTWHCPECEWEGVLAKRQPPKDAVINAIDKWWTWCCPQCNIMIAYDRPHPKYEMWGPQAIVFNRKAWDYICEQKVFSLETVSAFLGSAPEWLMRGADTFLGLDIPEHVKKEFEDYERNFSNKDGDFVQEVGDVQDVADGEDLGGDS